MSRINENTSLVLVKEAKRGKTKYHIKILYSKDKKIVRFTTNVYVKDSKSFKRDRVLRKNNALYPESFNEDREKINSLQFFYESLINDFVTEHLQKPSVHQLKDMIDEVKEQNQKVYTSMTDYLNEYEEFYTAKGRNSASVVKAFCSAFELYGIKMNKNFTFKNLHENFFIGFINFLLFDLPKRRHGKTKSRIPQHHLKEPFRFDSAFGMNNNTVLKRLQVFLQFINWMIKKKGVKLDYQKISENVKSATQKLEVKEYHNTKFAFRSIEEVRRLVSPTFDDVLKSDFYYDIVKGKKKKRFISKELLTKVRDYFAVSILTGNRISDLKRIKPHHIQLKTQKSQKTKSDFNLVSNDSVKSLLEKHNFNLGINDQKYNKCLKLLMKQFFVDFLKTPDAVLPQIERRGSIEEVTYKNKYDLVSSHAGRRSFATIAYFEAELPSQTIMQFTGHRSEREFNKYIQLSIEEDIERVSNFMNLNLA